MTSTSISAPDAHASHAYVPPSKAASPPDEADRKSLHEAFERALQNFLAARDWNCSVERPDNAKEERRAECAFLAADDRLIETPAASLSDLRAKLEVLMGDSGSTPLDRHLLAVFADLQCLTGNEPSRVFNAENWLRFFERVGGLYCLRENEVFLLSPKDANVEDALFQLETMGGRDAVKALILSRAAKEAQS